ncbi:hypothetical protein [Erythrobacter sp. JK5]|uniref:hypothetical protein n=1 Tax=Erythrobacter sp. JK5 TaxID=2829500 RepID=UPI001BADB344|nr:hypothetical protein [Erythrobacter sp. JK5]QUL37819.1 hypothetical protein KDC96_16070 [Erythrobacter sp. JK5]
MTDTSSTAAPARMMRRVYGLNVVCDLDLPELYPAEDSAEPDIVIREGDVPPPTADDPLNVSTFVDGEPGRLWLDFPDRLRMTISDGRSIIYTRYPGVAEDEMRLFLLGSGLGAILMQRGHVVVHGNAVSVDGSDRAIMCIGDTGAGKSTTAIAMLQRGHAMLADDVCPIGADGRVLPGMPRAKLWLDTAQRLGIDTSELARVREADPKFNLPIGDDQCRKPQAIGAFFWLVPEDVAQVQVRQLNGVEKFAVLRNNIYRPEYLLPLELEVLYLKRVAAIAQDTPLFRVSRPTAGFDIDALIDALLATFGTIPGTDPAGRDADRETMRATP